MVLKFFTDLKRKIFLNSKIAAKTYTSVKYFCVQKMSVIGRQENIKWYVFRIDGEMPKMNPLLHYENKQVFTWPLFKSSVDFRIEKYSCGSF